MSDKELKPCGCIGGCKLATTQGYNKPYWDEIPDGYYCELEQKIKMKSDFEYIEIGFENCDCVRIPPEVVEYLFIDFVTNSYTINRAKQYWETRTAKEIELGLKLDALRLKTSFDKYIKGNAFINHLRYYKDITHIYIKLPDKKEFGILVPWEPDAEYTNPFQKIGYKNKIITITIKE